MYAYAGVGNINQGKKYKKDYSPLLLLFLTKRKTIISCRYFVQLCVAVTAMTLNYWTFF